MAKSDSGQIIVKGGAGASLSALPKARGLPPVHLWNPPYCGEIDIRIARDGTWFHEGTPIGRPAMVKLFSGILKREEGRYFLVTPVEKVGITVEDAPLFVNDMDVAGEGTGQVLAFTTLTEDRVEAGEGHAIRVEIDRATGEPAPYIHIRAGLEARIDRKTFYRMVDRGAHGTVTEGGIERGWFGIWSRGMFFPIVPSDSLTEDPS